PVNTLVWLARVRGTWEYARSKSTPSPARRSMVGVAADFAPYAPTWSARNVSIVISRTFGRAGALVELCRGVCALHSSPQAARNTAEPTAIFIAAVPPPYASPALPPGGAPEPLKPLPMLRGCADHQARAGRRCAVPSALPPPCPDTPAFRPGLCIRAQSPGRSSPTCGTLPCSAESSVCEDMPRPDRTP